MVLQSTSRLEDARMTYTIVGAPGSGKRDVAEKLRAFLNEGECADSCFYIVPDEVERNPDDYGFLADYRSELYLASGRATFRSIHQNIIFTHSLIDNVVYTAMRVSDMNNIDPTNPRLLMLGVTFDACLGMLIDGRQSDVTLYLPYKGEDEDAQILDGALTDTLDSLKIVYTEIDPSTEVGTWITT
jgi:hypothetical protein